ncbi:MAG: FAD-dependent oxidoreductase [Verrucomicrobiia bacterium]
MDVSRDRHEAFKLKTVEDLLERIERLGLEIGVSHNIEKLFEPIRCGDFTLPNRFVVLPMEGCDGKSDGSPDELTFRRYRRFAAGGAGLLWFEATAVVPEGRANPRQLWLHKGSVNEFKNLVRETLKTARENFGENHRPLLIVQLTHSGRYSRPVRKPQPIIAHHSLYLDPVHNLPPDYPLISDEELKRLEDVYVEAARLAYEAGFDGVDIKACHRYLISELHASFTRQNSIYGGEAFENRTRFFRNIVQRIKSELPQLIVTARMNAYDAMPYPYGFGMDKNGSMAADLSEPVQLVRFLKENGAPLVNITIGNPYYNPNVNRPFDKPTAGAPIPAEHPLVGVERFIQIVRVIQQSFPELLVVGGGYSYLRHLLPYVAAWAVNKNYVSLVGLGRMAFAYPDCVRDLKELGFFKREKSCIACSACTQIMRDGGRSGCVPRDSEIYAPIYKEGRAEAIDTIVSMAAACRQCETPTCVNQCPAAVDIPRFVGYIAERRFREAYETIRAANILATICGYVCPAEVQCESGCVNQHFTNAVPIRHLQRWVCKLALEEGWASEKRKIPVLTGRRVAIIGAGPAGIGAAAKLAEEGHSVVIFERKLSAIGGLAATVIPQTRIPAQILTKEIEAVINSYPGLIELRQGVLGKDFTVDDLFFKYGFDAVVLAFGLQESIKLPCADKRPQSGVVGALEFLNKVRSGFRPDGLIYVLGGGNTAFDAALMAKLNGAKDVFIVYRRSFKEMPAWKESVDSALNAGVNILTNTMPTGYVCDENNNLKGLRVVRTILGSPDKSGRRAPVPIPNTEHILPADLVIEAIGQTIDEETKKGLTGVILTREGLIAVDKETLETSYPYVFAAGDVINGGGTVVRAVSDGMRIGAQLNKLFAEKPQPIPLNKKP